MAEKEEKKKKGEVEFNPDNILEHLNDELRVRLEAAERAYEKKVGLPSALSDDEMETAQKRLAAADNEIVEFLQSRRTTTGHATYVSSAKLDELNQLLAKGDPSGFGDVTVGQLQREINDGLLILSDFSEYPELLKRLHKKS